MRFAEHICQRLKAVLHNLAASWNVWAAISQKNSEKVEKLIRNSLLDFVGSGGKDHDRYHILSVC